MNQNQNHNQSTNDMVPASEQITTNRLRHHARSSRIQLMRTIGLGVSVKLVLCTPLHLYCIDCCILSVHCRIIERVLYIAVCSCRGYWTASVSSTDLTLQPPNRRLTPDLITRVQYRTYHLNCAQNAYRWEHLPGSRYVVRYIKCWRTAPAIQRHAPLSPRLHERKK